MFLIRSASCVALLILSPIVMPPSAEAFVPATPSTTEQAAVALAGLRRRVISSPANINQKKTFLNPTPLPGFGSWTCVNRFCRYCPPPTSVCSVIGDAADDNSFSTDSESDGSMDVSQQQASGGWREKLLKASNFASLLCVLDCTILPLVTVILPLFGIVAASPAQMEWLHMAGHRVALSFVLPVGGLATTLNYSNHKKKWIAALGYFGLLSVFVANAGCHWTHDLPGPIGHTLHRWLHFFHHGVIHRVTNLAGCALLLFSNFLSRRQGGCKDPHCTHDH